MGRSKSEKRASKKARKAEKQQVSDTDAMAALEEELFGSDADLAAARQPYSASEVTSTRAPTDSVAPSVSSTVAASQPASGAAAPEGHPKIADDPAAGLAKAGEKVDVKEEIVVEPPLAAVAVMQEDTVVKAEESGSGASDSEDADCANACQCCGGKEDRIKSLAFI